MKHLFFKLSAVLIASTLLFTSCDEDDKDPVVTPPMQLTVSCMV